MVGFKLGKSSSELKEQLREQAAKFCENITSFESQKTHFELKLSTFQSLIDELEAGAKLDELFEELKKLEYFHCLQLVRAGEDIVDMIFRKLDKKGVPVDARLEFQHDERKAFLAESAKWLKDTKQGVMSFYHRLDRPLPSKKKTIIDVSGSSSDSASSSGEQFESSDDDFLQSEPQDQSDDDFFDNGYEYENDDDHDDYRRYDDTSSKYQRDISSSWSNQGFQKKRDQRWRKISRQSSLDDFTHRQTKKQHFHEIFPTKSQVSRKSTVVKQHSGNFRVLPEQRNQTREAEEQENRWNWIKFAQKKVSKVSKARRHHALSLRRTSQSGQVSNSTAPLHQAKSKNTSGKKESNSLYKALQTLREKRYQSIKPHREKMGPVNISTKPIVVTASLSLGCEAYDNKVSFSHLSERWEKQSSTTTASNAWSTKGSFSSSNEESVFIDEDHIYEVVTPDVVIEDTRRLLSIEHQLIGVYFQKGMVEIALEKLVQIPLLDLHGMDSLMLNEAKPTELSRIFNRLRRQLNELRLQEMDFLMEMLHQSDEADDEQTNDDNNYKDSSSWKKLKSNASFCHTQLSTLLKYLLINRASININSRHEWLKEIQLTLRTLSSCGVLFGNHEMGAGYVFYYEGLDPSAKTTPFLTTIMRVYWYMLQITVILDDLRRDVSTKRTCTTMDGEVQLKATHVIFACALFLIDLYLYLPTSHRMKNIPMSESNTSDINLDIPAIYVWMMIYKMFLEGHVCFSKKVVTDGGTNHEEGAKEFWAFLQFLSRSKFIFRLTMGFFYGRPCSSYLDELESTAVHLDDNLKQKKQCELLASNCTWELIMILASVCDDSSLKSDVSSAKWAVVQDLVNFKDKSFLPCASKRILARNILLPLLVLSQSWSSNSDIIEKAITLLQNPNDESEEKNLKSFSLFDQIKADDFNEIAVNFNTWHTKNPTVINLNDTSSILLLIMMVQILKIKKRALRNRFRQPILRLLTSFKSLEIRTTTQNINEQQWKWTSGEKSTASTVSAVAIKKEQPKVVPQKPSDGSKAKVSLSTILSALLTLALSSIHANIVESESKHGNCLIRNQIKREVEYFCDEMASVCTSYKFLGAKMFTLSLATMGKFLLQSAYLPFVVYAPIFRRLNNQIVEMVTTLREIYHENIVSASGKNTPGLGSSKKQPFTSVISSQKSQLEVVKAAIQSCLKQMEKLICLMCESHEKILQEDMKESIGFVLNTGLESVIEATMDKLIAYDALMDVLKIVWNLHVSFQISQSLAYKCKYKEYLFRLKKVPVPPTTLQSIEVDDEFDDQEMMNIFATVDIDNAISGASTKSSQNTSEQSWKDKEHHSTTISSFISTQLLSHLRVPLQRVLINFPSSIYEKEPAMEDVIVELFGLLLSSSSFTFHWSWSWLNTATGKNRSLGPRLLSVTLKNNPSWLRGYLNLDQIATKKESEAQEIATLWLEATLDIKTFTESKTTKTFHLKNLTKNSMYWWILTDSILYDLLQPDIHRESSCNMINLLIKTSEQTVHQLIQMGLLKDDAEMVAFSTLETYEMHRLWFKNFCTCVSQIWNDLKDSGARRNFRQNIMGDTFTRNKGVFAVLLQSYEQNAIYLCEELKKSQSNWYVMAQTFLGIWTNSSSSYPPHTSGSDFHTFEDQLDRMIDFSTVQLSKAQRQALLFVMVFFRFMYDAVDIFLVHCADMAIGQKNIFFSVIELMFPQTKSAEYTQAAKKLSLLGTSSIPAVLGGTGGSSSTKSNTNSTSAASRTAGYFNASKECVGVMESIRTFFAYQKYPSLFHWFCKTQDTYQTIKSGWPQSPLRILLLNVLDPDGPLGVQSYYPIDLNTKEEVVGRIRREAYYLSCGLLLCRCRRTIGFSCQVDNDARPTNHQTDTFSMLKLRQLRYFILNDFMQEMLGFAEKETFYETLLPLLQLFKAFINHINLQEVSVKAEVALEDFASLIETVLWYFTRSQSAENVLQDPLCCVLLVELAGLMEEFAKIYPMVQDKEKKQRFFKELMKLALKMYGKIYDIMQKRISPSLATLFCIDMITVECTDWKPHSPSLWHQLCSSYQATESADAYGLSLTRTRVDLLTAIQHLVHQVKISCEKDSDLLSFFI